MNWIVIPARKGSKGFPRKNRVLFDYTAKMIPSNMKRKVIVTTDDTDIMGKAEYYGFEVHNRPSNLAKDDTSTKEVLEDIVKNSGYSFSEKDIFVMLYLTYPQRTWDEVEKAYSFFQTFEASSLLCREEIENEKHPFLWLLDQDEGRGKQLVEHDFYRRQDYPNMFKICHFISIMYVSELSKLNNNLYNKKTVFFPIDIKIDVDTEKDFLRFQKENENENSPRHFIK